MAARHSLRRIWLIVFSAIVALIVAMHLWFIVPGLLAGRPFVGTPNSGAIYSSGGFHCPHDGLNRIHYHTCDGEAVALPEGTQPSDFPNHDQ